MHNKNDLPSTDPLAILHNKDIPISSSDNYNYSCMLPLWGNASSKVQYNIILWYVDNCM